MRLLRSILAPLSLLVALGLAACGRDGDRVTSPGDLAWSSQNPTFVEGLPSVSVRLVPIGGVPPYAFEPAGSLPPGLRLTRDGRLVGSPGALGEFRYDVRVSDSRGHSAVLSAVLNINQASNRSFPELLSQRPLTTDEMTWVLGSREVERMRKWALRAGYTVDLVAASYLRFDRPGAEMVGLPLRSRTTNEEVWGSVYLIHPFQLGEEAMAYVAYPSDSAPRIVFYGGDGGTVTHYFNATRKSVRVAVTDGSGCGPTWEKFKKWLSSTSPAGDLPWWLDLLCGIVCGDALLGTHNPWSISACLHCVAAYIAACVEVGPSPTLAVPVN